MLCINMFLISTTSPSDCLYDIQACCLSSISLIKFITCLYCQVDFTVQDPSFLFLSSNSCLHCHPFVIEVAQMTILQNLMKLCKSSKYKIDSVY